MAGSGFRTGVVVPTLLVVLLAGCGDRQPGLSEGRETMETYTAQQIFERGDYELGRGRFKDAATYYAEVERLHPYSELAKRAIIMQAVANHQGQNYVEARASAQRFLDTYPADEDAAYASYLRALSYYDQIDEIGRDQGLTFEALQALRAVIEGYPGSEYARSAILKFDLAFDHLAAKEMEVGRYYLKHQNYAAAANRFRLVVEEFQTTTHVPEALHRLVEAYLSIGLTDEAQTAGAILGYNFRSTEWYERSYALLTGRGLEMKSTGNNWLSSVYRQTIRGEWL